MCTVYQSSYVTSVSPIQKEFATVAVPLSSVPVLKLFAGTAGVSGHADGTSSEARFNFPGGITSDGVNLYITEYTHDIRKIVISTGYVTTTAGISGVYGRTNGVGTEALFNSPLGLVFFENQITHEKNIYVSESQNNCIRVINP